MEFTDKQEKLFHEWLYNTQIETHGSSFVFGFFIKPYGEDCIYINTESYDNWLDTKREEYIKL